MKKILNEWRQFINEDAGYYGDSYKEFNDTMNQKWEEYKADEEKSEALLSVAIDAKHMAEKNFRKMGEGQFRNAYLIDDDKTERILKIAKFQKTTWGFDGEEEASEEHLKAAISDNKDELKVSHQSHLSDIMIQVGDYGPVKKYPIWIVTEKVRTFESYKEMIQKFDAFANRTAQGFIDTYNMGASDLFFSYLVGALVDRAISAKKNGNFEESYKKSLDEIFFRWRDNKKEYAIEAYEESRDHSDENLRKLENYVSRYPVLINDLSKSNMALDSKGNVVVLDASMLDYDTFKPTEKKVSQYLKEKVQVPE